MTVVAAHNLTVFLVALWGYTALLLTGEFSIPILIACYALAFAAFLARRKNVEAPRWLWNIISIIALIAAGAMATRQLLDATVYLFLFLQVVKLFTARTAVESRWSYIISLFQVIGASVLTTSMTFGLVFLVYVLLMVFSLLLYTLRRESETSERISGSLYSKVLDATHGRTTRPRLRIPWALKARIPRGLIWTSASLTILIVAATIVTFAIVPRLATQNLFQGYGKPPEKPSLSAFDEAIEFGTFEKIQLDNAVAMFVQPLEKKRRDHIRLRGVALDTFDGRAWRRTTSSHGVTGPLQFPAFTTRLYSDIATHRIIQPPGITQYLFAETFAESIKVASEIQYYSDGLSGAAWLASMQPKEFQYVSSSRVESLDERKDPARNNLRERALSMFSSAPFPQDISLRFRDIQQRFANEGSSATRERRYPRFFSRGAHAEQLRYLERCTTLPAMLSTNNLRDLAVTWTRDAATTFEKSLAIESRLRSEFTYSLEPKARGNYIEDFLFRTKQGHCEYFATSMAVLVRSLGVPARVVNGYYSVEWNNIGGNFTVRQRDAHSWVEVWLANDYGWMTFDPTPPSGVGRPNRQNAVLLAISRYLDALRVRWYRYVVDYSITDQAAVMRTLANARDRINSFFGRMQNRIWLPDLSSSTNVGGAHTYVNVLIAAALACGAVVFGVWAAGNLRPKRKRRRPETMVRYYSELLRLLAAKGFKLATGETPREYASRLRRVEVFSPLMPITEMYYSSRYQGHAPTDEELAIIEEFRKALKTSPRAAPETL
ncbi:MAG: transglutaminase TgpA family protein [Candidatus Sumerlaeaceae bacterium]